MDIAEKILIALGFSFVMLIFTTIMVDTVARRQTLRHLVEHGVPALEAKCAVGS